MKVITWRCDLCGKKKGTGVSLPGSLHSWGATDPFVVHVCDSCMVKRTIADLMEALRKAAAKAAGT